MKNNDRVPSSSFKESCFVSPNFFFFLGDMSEHAVDLLERNTLLSLGAGSFEGTLRTKRRTSLRLGCLPLLDGGFYCKRRLIPGKEDSCRLGVPPEKGVGFGLFGPDSAICTACVGRDRRECSRGRKIERIPG